MPTPIVKRAFLPLAFFPPSSLNPSSSQGYPTRRPRALSQTFGTFAVGGEIAPGTVEKGFLVPSASSKIPRIPKSFADPKSRSIKIPVFSAKSRNVLYNFLLRDRAPCALFDNPVEFDPVPLRDPRSANGKEPARFAPSIRFRDPVVRQAV